MGLRFATEYIRRARRWHRGHSRSRHSCGNLPRTTAAGSPLRFESIPAVEHGGLFLLLQCSAAICQACCDARPASSIVPLPAFCGALSFEEVGLGWACGQDLGHCHAMLPAGLQVSWSASCSRKPNRKREKTSPATSSMPEPRCQSLEVLQ